MTATGTLSRKTPFQVATVRITPATMDPATLAMPLTPDHSAIAPVRAVPSRQRAVMRESVVGYAMPAASPVATRATIRNSTEGASADIRLATIVSTSPSMSSCLRP